MGVERRPIAMVGRMSGHAHGGRGVLFHGGGGRSLIWNLLAVTSMVSRKDHRVWRGSMEAVTRAASVAKAVRSAMYGKLSSCDTRLG
jgi:hypothetical protein